MTAVVGLPSSAAALTCPTADGTTELAGYQFYYTVSPASACVWGQGTISPNNDDFLGGWPALDSDEGAWPTVANPILTGGAWSPVEYTSSGGDGAVLDVNANGTWTITGALANTEYLLGLKQGSNPQWAVFLVTAFSGTWDINDTFSLSHIALYSRTVTTTGTSTSSGQAVVPEPASLLLL